MPTGRSRSPTRRSGPDPDDRAVLAFRRRAFAAKGDQTGVAATIAALRRTPGGDDLIDSERRLQGDLAETDPRWRPRVRGPRRPTEPRSDRAVLHLLKESLPQRQTGFTMRSHANLLAQRAAGWDPVVVTALGFPRSVGARCDDARGDRRDPASPARPWRRVSARRAGRHAASRTTPGGPRPSPARSGRRSSTPRRAVAATSRRWSGWRSGEHLDLPVVYEVRSLFDGPRIERRSAPRPTRPRPGSATGVATRPRCARCWRRTPW